MCSCLGNLLASMRTRPTCPVFSLAYCCAPGPQCLEYVLATWCEGAFSDSSDGICSIFFYVLHRPSMFHSENHDLVEVELCLEGQACPFRSHAELWWRPKATLVVAILLSTPFLSMATVLESVLPRYSSFHLLNLK